MRRKPRLAIRYWRSLPMSRLATMLAGVFFIFASVGFIMASWQIDASRPWPAVL